jgi:hypothetical protein
VLLVRLEVEERAGVAVEGLIAGPDLHRPAEDE